MMIGAVPDFGFFVQNFVLSLFKWNKTKAVSLLKLPDVFIFFLGSFPSQETKTPALLKETAFSYLLRRIHRFSSHINFQHIIQRTDIL